MVILAMLMMVLVLVAIGAGFTLLARRSRQQAQLERLPLSARQPAQGEIVRALDDTGDMLRTSWSYHIRFTTQTGQEIVARTSVTQENLLGKNAGDLVTIYYLPTKPDHIWLGEDMNSNPQVVSVISTFMAGSIGCTTLFIGLIALTILLFLFLIRR